MPDYVNIILVITLIKGLYIHIPFCQNICHYCDFTKMVAGAELKTKYIDHLILELGHYRDRLDDLETIYIGGGTPSCLNIDLLETLLKAFNSSIDMDQIAEFTIEANPNDIDHPMADLFHRYKINRVSLGVQTFNEKLLTSIGRTHNAADIEKSVAILRDHKILNINFDLMYRLPEQKVIDVASDLKLALALKPEHISYYALILEEKTVFYHDFQMGKLKMISEDDEVNMSEMITDMLEQRLYHRYEISNYSLSGKESRHNLLYWNLEEYLGLGMGSASQIDETRFVNKKTLKEYLKQVGSTGNGFDKFEDFNPRQEMIMLGLRITEGLAKQKFEQRFSESVFKAFPDLKKHVATGLLIDGKTHIYLSQRGMDLANHVMTSLF